MHKKHLFVGGKGMRLNTKSIQRVIFQEVLFTFKLQMVKSMEALKDFKSRATTVSKRSPSLLRQIMDEMDDLDAEKKEALLWRIKMEKALYMAKQADDAYMDKFLPLNDDEIANIVSANRKADYDAKIHHLYCCFYKF
jgi:hypothetical protein